MSEIPGDLPLCMDGTMLDGFCHHAGGRRHPIGHPDSITCPQCGRTSYNPNDIAEGYCGNCHDWTSSPRRQP